jgi:DNA modification methylase
LFPDLIIPDERQRQEFDPEALTDLANSISGRGLLHAVVVRETPSGYALVAGERRLRAMETLWMLGDGVTHNGRTYAPYEVPFVTLGELSPLEAEEAELDENLKRQDLTWQERSSALSRLHKLRVAQAHAVGIAGPSMLDTHNEAKDAGYTTARPQETRAEILLAEHLSNPEVARAKSAPEALKILKKAEDRERNIALGASVGRDYNSSVHKLHHVDCLDWLGDCPDNQFDVILTDPPYGMNAQSFGDGGGKLVNSAHAYDDSPEAWRTLLSFFAPEAYRIAKPQAHAYIFCDFDRFHELKFLMQEAGWYVFRTPLVIHKVGSGRVPLPDHGPRRQYELALYAIKGNKPVTGIYSDVISCKLEENLTHGANKPVELYVDLLKRSCRPGDMVLDAFAGSGTIFPAAHQCKLYATGLEISPEYYGIAVNRLNGLDDELSML